MDKERIERYKKAGSAYISYVLTFIKWLNIGLLLGVLGGVVGTAFCYSIGYVTNMRETYPALIWLLPVGGMTIVFLFKTCGLHPTDTNGVLLAVHKPASISPSTGPLIFIGSVLTHLFGGSAGREAQPCRWAGSWAGTRQIF